MVVRFCCPTATMIFDDGGGLFATTSASIVAHRGSVVVMGEKVGDGSPPAWAVAASPEDIPDTLSVDFWSEDSQFVNHEELP